MWLYRLIRIYTLFLAIIPAIGFYRASVQPLYNWGLFVIHGQGKSGGYWWLIVFIIFAWLTFILEVWYKKKWYYLLLIALFSYLPVVLIAGYFTGTQMTIQGDAWQIHTVAGRVVFIVSLILLILGIIWSIHDLKKFTPKRIQLSSFSILKVVIVILFGLIILWLFGQGQGGVHTLYDRVAVGLTIAQALILAHFVETNYKTNPNQST